MQAPAPFLIRRQRLLCMVAAFLFLGALGGPSSFAAGDNRDTIGVFRNGAWFLSNDFSGGVHSRGGLSWGVGHGLITVGALGLILSRVIVDHPARVQGRPTAALV